MDYRILFDKKAEKDLKKIDKVWQKKILQSVREAIAKEPYRGKRLLGNWSPFFRWRVGDYRIIYDIDDTTVTIEVIRIRHRKEVY
ncbi:type II toxin-antitoxin system RelE/ParE family toxin [Hydrogenimonas sp. SS33]|uniref:type II toxin-antitoxin system RelE family toxin n=1 Tax=Hydrogenimonas leucolamina TaxID=2954236 RepID=UPI00336BE0E9